MQKKKSKRIQKRDKGVCFSTVYTVPEALRLLKERGQMGQGGVQFDPTVEFVLNCNLNPSKGDQAIRALLSLPHGTGRRLRVGVFAEDDAAVAARDAGADVVGGQDLVEQVQQGKIDFDFCIATPSMMSEVGKLGRVLGPKGLMPSPKMETVTMDVAGAVQRAKRGQVELRPEKAGIIQGRLGKLSFSTEQLEENFLYVCEQLKALRPSGLKGDLIQKMGISCTMGFCLSVKI